MPIHYNSKVKTVVEQTRNAQYSSWTICSLVFYYMLFLQAKQQNTSKLTKSEEKERIHWRPRLNTKQI